VKRDRNVRREEGSKRSPISHRQSWPSCAACLALALLTTGCGTNQFQREVETEAAAIKLVGETQKGQYPLISTQELKELISSGDDFLLLDAMPAAASYNKAHIKGAVNFEFPKEVLETWSDDAIGGGSKSDYEKLLGDDKDRKIVVYCGFVKCARSHNAAIFAQELGFTNVYRYPGGIHAWKGAGHSVTSEQGHAHDSHPRVHICSHRTTCSRSLPICRSTSIFRFTCR